MSTLLDEPSVITTSNPSVRLCVTMAAVRVAFTWFGVRKSLSPEQRSQAADTFGAEGEFLSAGKKLLDTRHPAFKAVTAVRGQMLIFWKGISLPYPEPGIRLIRQDDIASFDVQMTTLKRSSIPRNRIKEMNVPQANSTVADAPAPATKPRKRISPVTSMTPIEQAIALRDTLHAAAKLANGLAHEFKHQKRQARIVESTLSSLKQLQKLAG